MKLCKDCKYFDGKSICLHESSRVPETVNHVTGERKPAWFREADRLRSWGGRDRCGLDAQFFEPKAVTRQKTKYMAERLEPYLLPKRENVFPLWRFLRMGRYCTLEDRLFQTKVLMVISIVAALLSVVLVFLIPEN